MSTAMSSSNRSMFWRIIRRLLAANRGRLVVILLALGAGAAITAALLNLQVDAKRRITTEFRTFGPNVVIAPRGEDDPSRQRTTMPESTLENIPRLNDGNQVVSVGWLSLIANVRRQVSSNASATFAPIVITGHTGGIQQELLNKVKKFAAAPPARSSARNPINTLPYCNLGTKAAAALNVHEGDTLLLRYASVEETCSVELVFSYGGQQDNQISVYIETAQKLANLPGRVDLIEIVVPGTPHSIEHFIADLQPRFSNADVRPIRQFTEGEAKIYDRISGILSATVALVLLLTALCVMAAMTNVAMERRNDVGLMKAIGGATRRVLRLFLAEAALLGLTGGVLGAAVGILLSMWLGKAVFGVAARPRLIVYPVSVALTIIVAIAGAYPLRRLANIRPAAVFRGEA